LKPAKKQTQFKAKQACPFGKLRAGSEQRRMEPIIFSPQMLWGLKGRFEKTNPILKKQN